MSDNLATKNDVSRILSHISSVSSEIHRVENSVERVRGDVVQVQRQQSDLDNRVSSMRAVLDQFIRDDRQQKALQLAETRVTKFRQELLAEFGYFAEIRRMAQGFITGMEGGMVSHDTLKLISEEAMVKAPGYWLASSIVSIAAWYRENTEVAVRAKEHALKQSASHAVLFFLLVAHRLGQHQAGLKWLQRYLQAKDPKSLNREFVIVMEAIAVGAFPATCRELLIRHIAGWVRQMADSTNLQQEQQQRWLDFFVSHSRMPLNTKFELAARTVANWEAVEAALQHVCAHEAIGVFFKQAMQPLDLKPGPYEARLDELLKWLVTNYDPRELPLQEKIRLNELIIEANGDVEAAQARMRAEQSVFRERVDFLSLITNTALQPSATGVSRLTQQLAISVCRPWIVDAFDAYLAVCDDARIATVDATIEGCT